MFSALPRHKMIDGQLEPNRVLDSAVLAAMGVVPREIFMPENYRQAAYLDEMVPLGKGRYVSSPLTLGHLLQALEVEAGQKTMVVAAGTGYGAAVLHQLGCQVHAVEESQDLANKSRQLLMENGFKDIQVFTASLPVGVPSHAPYDRILIDGALPQQPESLLQQLCPEGGRLCYVLAENAAPLQSSCYGCIVVVRREGERFVTSKGESVFAPSLVPHEPKERFQFDA